MKTPVIQKVALRHFDGAKWKRNLILKEGDTSTTLGMTGDIISNTTKWSEYGEALTEGNLLYTQKQRSFSVC